MLAQATSLTIDTSTQWWIIAGVGFYLLGMIGIGIWAASRISNTKDYIVAGNSLPWWLCTATIFATWFGAETCMGASAASYKNGMLGAIADPFGAGLCLIIAGLFFAPMLYRLKIETITDYFTHRYGQKAAMALTVYYVPTYLGWVGAQLVAFGTILNTLTGIDLYVAIFAATAVILFYTYFGGIWADTISDFFQMVIILIAFAVIAAWTYWHFADYHIDTSKLPENFFSFYPREGTVFSWLHYTESWIVVGLGCLAGQDLLARILSAKSEKTAIYSSIGAGFLYWTIGLVPVFLGIYGRCLLPADYAIEQESLLIDLSIGFLPAPLIALMIGCLLAAIMSSADSAILAPAAIIGKNIIPHFRPQTTEEEQLKYCKLCTLLVALSSLGLALWFQDIYQMCKNAWTFLLVSVTPALIFGMYLPRATPQAAVVSSVVGAASWLAAAAYWGEEYPVKLFGFVMSCLCFVVVSYAKQEPALNRSEDLAL